MKRYLVFIGNNYYASGGMGDFDSAHDTVEEAERALDKMRDNDEKWGHIYDQEEAIMIDEI